MPLCPVIIGRDDLLALADRRLAAARSGTGELLLLAGEAGIGKTRLLAEVRDRAAGQGFRVAGAGAYPRDVEAAGGVLAELASALRRVPGWTGAGDRMAGRLRERARDGDPYRQRRLLITDLAAEIVALGTGPDPVLLALEDLHWADDVTLAVLDRVAAGLGEVPVLLVGTYRSDELYPRVPMRAWRTRLLTQRLAEEARLPRLDATQTAAMAVAIADAALPADLTTALYERSDGIPLHVEEFLASAGGTALPDTLADAVLVRAQGLTRSARALADAASVIGRSFDLDLLAAVADRGGPELDAALGELVDRFFVRPRGDGAAYDFRHALIRDALYADLPPLRRRDLHARVAAAAVAAGFRYAFVSDQYERAHQPAEAYRYALAAAAEARALSAHREAVVLYRRAQRTAPTGTPLADRADLLAALAGELAAIDDNAAAADGYAQAVDLRRRLGDDKGAAALVPALVAARHLLGADLAERTGRLRAALDTLDAPDPALLSALAAAYMLDRRLADAVRYGRQARDLATDRATRIDTDITLGAALVFTDRAAEGWPLLEEALAEAAAGQLEAEAAAGQLEAEAARAYRMLCSASSVLVAYDRALRWLPEGIAYAARTERYNDLHYMAAHLAHVHWAVGEWAAAERGARQALADGRGGVTTRITALHVLGYLALGRGDRPDAEERLHEALELGERMGELQRLSPALWGLAETALHSGQAAAAVAWCERGYRASEAVRDAAYLFPFVVTGTRGYLALDEPSRARDWVDRCTELLTYRSLPGTLPALDHARGLLHLADGRTGQAREALTRAGDGWDRYRRFWEGTHALLDRARAARRSRRPAEAGALIEEANRRAVTAGAAALVADPPEHASAGDGSPLTAREIEVARLVAAGATNREIATALAISPKTVAAHIEHILTKLGAARRTEIATWATVHTGRSG